MGSLAVGALKPRSVLDGLCATGARGVRYAVENGGVGRIVLLDANPDAVAFAKKNVSLNKLSKRAEAVCADFEEYCLSHEGEFDFVEVDPFGTPAPFVESALEALRKPGVLSLTATDLANLVKKNAPTLRDYGAKPLYNDFSHETALRILLGFLARKAAEEKLSFEPLACFYERHYVKIISRIGRKKEPAGAFSKKLGFVSYCPSCVSRFAGKKSRCACGNRLLYAGPLWTGDCCSGELLRKMAGLNEKLDLEDKKRVGKMLSLLQGEQGRGFQPWFFDVHRFADFFGLAVEKKMDEIVGDLRSAGFKAEKTHFSPTGIKTNASAGELKKILSAKAA